MNNSFFNQETINAHFVRALYYWLIGDEDLSTGEIVLANYAKNDILIQVGSEAIDEGDHIVIYENKLSVEDYMGFPAFKEE